MEREQAVRLTQNLLKKMVEKEGSDLFITCGFPPAIKVDGSVHKATDTPLTADQSAMMVRSIMNDKQVKEFDATKECNFAIAPQGIGRFRVSAFIQQGMVGAVLRTITTEIPTLEGLNLPPILKDVVMNKRGLVIVVGGTGSGKSTTLAAMIGHRNKHSKGHIISIEDPVEYVHPHEGCVITQREVGVDTETWHAALKNTLRQAPDVIMIGEIRDRETMEYGIQFSETGHLCLATLHANSANQALDRIINFFPEERRTQLLMDLSLNTKAFVSQRRRVSACRPLTRRCIRSTRTPIFHTRKRCAMPIRRTSSGCGSSWRVNANRRISSPKACELWKKTRLKLTSANSYGCQH